MSDLVNKKNENEYGKCKNCTYFGRAGDAPETVAMDCMWQPGEKEDYESLPCEECKMSNLVSKEVVIRAIKDYLIDLLERNIQYVDVHDFNIWIHDIVNKLPAENEWISVEYELPVDDRYVLLSFENLNLPAIGKYKKTEDGGGTWYIEKIDGKDICIANDLFVNAWMPLSKCYEEEK